MHLYTQCFCIYGLPKFRPGTWLSDMFQCERPYQYSEWQNEFLLSLKTGSASSLKVLPRSSADQQNSFSHAESQYCQQQVRHHFANENRQRMTKWRFLCAEGSRAQFRCRRHSMSGKSSDDWVNPSPCIWGGNREILDNRVDYKNIIKPYSIIQRI